MSELGPAAPDDHDEIDGGEQGEQTAGDREAGEGPLAGGAVGGEAAAQIAKPAVASANSGVKVSDSR